MAESSFYTTMESPLGEIVLTSNGEALTGLYIPNNTRFIQAHQGMNKNVKPFADAIRQLNEYFAGTRREFNVPLAPSGTDFQERVWAALQRIPFAETRSYGDLAKSLGDANASRAVGTANGKNPICLIVPCHRVINADGKLGGYNGGLQAKEWLLHHEQKYAAIKMAS